MKQRVAIARAYAVQPEVLLMDEPFGALDAQTRTQLQSELIHTWQEEKKTCFFITHDVEEAIILANKVIIMSARPGRIKKVVDIDLPYPRTQEMKMGKALLGSEGLHLGRGVQGVPGGTQVRAASGARGRLEQKPVGSHWPGVWMSCSAAAA